jgi:hypothetical protein
MAFVRLAGTFPLEDGGRLTWSLAEGRHGRRWRSTTLAADGRLAVVLLLEVAPDGRPSKLELAGAGGLLTLHPDEGGGLLHGNVVRQTGIEHVSIPWSADHVLVVTASPVTAAVAARWLAGRTGVGEGASVKAVEVGPDLHPRPATWRVARFGEDRWHLGPAGSGDGVTVDLDEAGIPMGYAGERAWPLELTAGD